MALVQNTVQRHCVMMAKIKTDVAKNAATFL